MSACCAHCCSCSCCNSFICLCNFMFFLELLLQHMQLLLCSILCLRMIFMSRRRLITWVSKVAFMISGSSWACNFVLSLYCQQPSSCICCIRFIHYIHFVHCICCIWYVSFSCCSMLLAVMLLLSYLDVLVYKQLDIFVSRQAHRHLIDYISRCALNGVFNSAFLETIVLALMRGIWTLAIPGDMETLVASNLSVENQNELENWLATYLCDWSWRSHNFGWEVGRLTAKTVRGIFWAAGRLNYCCNFAMHNPV